MSRATKVKTITIRLNGDDTFGITVNYRKLGPQIYISTEDARTLARIFSRLAMSCWVEVDGAVNSVKLEDDEEGPDSAGLDG